MEFRKKYIMKLADYTAFNLFHNKKLLIILPIVMYIFSFLFFTLTNSESATTIKTGVSLFLFGMIFGLFALLMIANVKRSSKKQYNASKIMQAENELIIDDEGLREYSEYGNAIIKWPDIFKAAESKKAFYLYMSKMQALIIPKRIATADDDVVLRTLIKNNLSQEKYRLKS